MKHFKSTIRLFVLGFISTLVFLLIAPRLRVRAVGNAVYLADADTGLHDGTSCGNAKAALAYFNSAGNWTAGTPTGIQIGPDTFVHLCGTINLDHAASFPSNVFVSQGSGTSGHPITILWEPGAIVQDTAISNLGGFIIQHSYIVLDGGLDANGGMNGVIQNTSDGTAGYNACLTGICSDVLGTGDIGSIFIKLDSASSNVTIKNLSMRHGYVRQPNANDLGHVPQIIPDGEVIQIIGGSSNDLITNCEMDSQTTGIGSNGDQVEISYSIFRSINHPITQGPAANGTNTCPSIHDNDFSGGGEWDDDSSNHFHMDWIFFQSGGYGTCQNGQVYNNYMHGIQSYPGSMTSHISGALAVFDGGNCGPTNPGTLSSFSSMKMWNNIIEYDDAANNPGLDALVIGWGGETGWFVNNTIVSLGHNTPKMWAPSPHSTDPTCTGVAAYNNLRSMNNLLVSGLSGGGAQMNLAPQPYGNPSFIDYNMYAGVATASGTFSCQDGTAMTFSQWQTPNFGGDTGCGGFDVNGSNPSVASVSISTSSFVPSGAGSAHLGGVDLTSLCATVPGLCTDRQGNARPSGTRWDSGAFQTSSTPHTMAFTMQPTNTPSGGTLNVVVTLSAAVSDVISLIATEGVSNVGHTGCSANLTGTKSVSAASGTAALSVTIAGTGNGCMLTAYDVTDSRVLNVDSVPFDLVAGGVSLPVNPGVNRTRRR